MISNYDENYETIKNEFYHLYNNVLNINDSLNYHNNTIRDLYLNENSTLNLLNRYFNYNQNNHPIGSHSSKLLYSFTSTFDSWNRDQQIQFQTINRYITQLDNIKSKIERLESSVNSNDSLRLKNEVFKDVIQQFDNRVGQFDIPIINIQNSFHSLIQSLNSNLSESSVSLQNPINFVSPISHLRSQQQQQQHPPQPNNNLVRNTLPQIPKPTPSRPIYNPPQVYSPPTQSHSPIQQSYSQSSQNNSYQQYYPPTQQPIQQPPIPEKKTVKSSLKQIERPAPVVLPESTFIEPEIKRKPGDFLRDPKAPKYVPEKVEPIRKSDTLSHHNMSLSESRAHAMAHKPAPLPPR